MAKASPFDAILNPLFSILAARPFQRWRET